VPAGRKVTYEYFDADVKEQKEEQERTILTMGGDQIEHTGGKSTRTAGIATAKIIISSTISTKGERFLVIDIKKIYLNTPSVGMNIWSSTCRRSLRKSSRNTIYWS
jgi:hypothetical protein